MNNTDLQSLPRQSVPAFPGWWAALGPGVVWMALAQGSGELIWWPYMIAKYGLTFLWLLVPACLLQYPLNLEIGRYTMLTGESIFHGFIRLHRGFGIFLWLLMTVSFLWFGAFASAGGTAMAELTHWPTGWTQRGQSLFWGYASIAVFITAILASGVVYTLIERFMKLVAVVTVVGLMSACLQSDVLKALPTFSLGLLGPVGEMPRPWDSADASKLLTAITFAGLGGFWILFYSYWLRDKGAGMAGLVGRITGLGGAEEAVLSDGFLPADEAESAKKLVDLATVFKRGHIGRHYRQSAHHADDLSAGLCAVVSQRFAAAGIRTGGGAKPVFCGELGRDRPLTVFGGGGRVFNRHLAGHRRRGQPYPDRYYFDLVSEKPPSAGPALVLHLSGLIDGHHLADHATRRPWPADFNQRDHRLRRHHHVPGGVVSDQPQNAAATFAGMGQT